LFRDYFPNRNLFYLWFGQWISLAGDQLYQLGLLWWVLKVFDSNQLVGVMGACIFLPTLLFGIIGGAVADRLGYRRVMVWADVFRLLVVLVLVGAFSLDSIHPVFLMGVTFLVATGGAFFNPAKDALIPELAPGADLVRINAVQQSSWPFALLLGTLLAFGTIHNPIMLFSLDAFSFLISMVLILKIRHSWGRTHQPVTDITTHRWKEMLRGFSIVGADRRLSAMLVLTAVDNLLIMGPAMVGLSIFVKDHLQLPGQYYASMESAYGFGMILATLVIHRLSSKIPKGWLLALGLFFDGITYVPMYWSNTFASTYIIFFIHSWAIPMIIVGRTAIIQGLVPEGYRGRVFSLANITVVGMTALSAALTGLMAEIIPIHLLFTLIGAGGALCGVAAMLYRPLREVK
jgi:MFS transporter, DHA3 family, macrolide efflux protein